MKEQTKFSQRKKKKYRQIYSQNQYSICVKFNYSFIIQDNGNTIVLLYLS